MNLPTAPRELHRMLAVRIWGAAVVIGALAGAVAWNLESRRVDAAAMELAVAGARHWQSSAMQALADGKPAQQHRALNALVDQKSNFIGIRVFDDQGKLAYQTSAKLPADADKAFSAQPHVWPAPGEDHHKRIRTGTVHFIQVVLPLVRETGSLAGYLEGIYRLDAEAIATQKAQVLNSALTAVASVLVTALLLYPMLRALLRQSTRVSSRLLESNLSLLRSLGNAVAKRDSDTDAHNYRVTLYAAALAQTMNWPKREIAVLIPGALLHDVGKIGIPDHILLKPGKLTDGEFEIMKTHPLLGLEIVAGDDWLSAAAPVIRHHHERFDGSGYPDRLKGTEIPIGARLFAVVDVFDALVSQRPYKGSMPLTDALAYIDANSGRLFDPDVVTAFKRIAAQSYKDIGLAGDQALRAGMRLALSLYFSAEMTANDAEIPTVRMSHQPA